jgi:hypothetical protein
MGACAPVVGMELDTNSHRPFPTVLVSTRAPGQKFDANGVWIPYFPPPPPAVWQTGQTDSSPLSLAHNHHQPQHEPNPIHTLAPSRVRQSCATVSSKRSRCRTWHHYTTLPIILHIPTGTATPPRSTPHAMPVLMLTSQTNRMHTAATTVRYVKPTLQHLKPTRQLAHIYSPFLLLLSNHLVVTCQ